VGLFKSPLLQIQKRQNHVLSAFNIISGGGYDRNILKKIPEVPLCSIYRWYKFQNFSSKTQMKKYDRNSKNLKLWAQKYRHSPTLGYFMGPCPPECTCRCIKQEFLLCVCVTQCCLQYRELACSLPRTQVAGSNPLKEHKFAAFQSKNEIFIEYEYKLLWPVLQISETHSSIFNWLNQCSFGEGNAPGL